MAEDKTKNLELENEENEDDDEDQMTEGGTGKDKGSNDGKNKGEESTKNTEKTFTQDQVSKMMTKEKRQGKASAYKELGIDPSDTKAINLVKALIESQKTDDQKAAEKNAEEMSKIEEANMRALKAEIKAEAMQAGIQSQFVNDAVILIAAKMTDDSDLKTLIGEVKTKYPVWFTATDEDEDKGKSSKAAGQKGTGSSVKVGDTKGKEKEESLGARLAAQRKSNNVKSSYWGSNKK